MIETTEVGGPKSGISGLWDRVRGRGMTRQRTERAETVSPAQALDNFIERLKENSKTRYLGEGLEREHDSLLFSYREENRRNPNLSIEEFLERDSRSNTFYQTRLIPGRGWRVEALDLDGTMGDRKTRGGTLRSELFDILGDESSATIEQRFARSQRYDEWFIFEGDRGERVPTEFQSRVAWVKREGEESAVIRLWIRQEVGGPTGGAYIGKGAVRGFAIEIPIQTETQWIQSRFSQSAPTPA